MPSPTAPSQLPRTHYRITVARGGRARTLSIRALVAQGLAAASGLLFLVGLGSSAYLMAHDDIVAELMRREGAMQYAYEDRLEAMRQDIERQTERSHADAAAVDARVHDLFSREARLEGRAESLAVLGGDPAPRRPELPPEITGRIAAPPAAALGYAASDKPRPLPEPAVRGPADRFPEDHASLLDDPRVALPDRLRAVDLALDRAEHAQSDAVGRLQLAARDRAARIGDVIESVGLSPERFLPKGGAGVGGPFVPLPRGSDGFDRALAELRADAAAATQLGTVLPHLPLAVPVDGRVSVTSPFGARTDPFLGRPALHTGVDLAEGFGAEIRATGAGRVSFAGPAGGYGNMVEVDHGGGLSTRYAHMSTVAVTEGQAVSRGSLLGFVGATGRATGPHLHYEVRIDGEPVDPMRFLARAGRLAQVEAP